MSLFGFRNLFRAGSPDIPKDRLEGRAPRGLRLLPNFVTPQEREEIAAWIAAHVAWSCGSCDGNRLETYVDPSRPLPEWGQALGRRMREAGIFDGDPDYLHLISYQAGQGVRRHVDRDFLGAVVAGLTLGSSRVFEFARAGKEDAFELACKGKSREAFEVARKGSKDVSARVLLLPGDLYVISGPARHRWEHGVPFAKEDLFGGRVYPRSQGWSATWRRVDRNDPGIAQYTRRQASA